MIALSGFEFSYHAISSVLLVTMSDKQDWTEWVLAELIKWSSALQYLVFCREIEKFVNNYVTIYFGCNEKFAVFSHHGNCDKFENLVIIFGHKWYMNCKLFSWCNSLQLLNNIFLSLTKNFVLGNLLDPSEIIFCILFSVSLVTMFLGKKHFLSEITMLLYSVIEMFINMIDCWWYSSMVPSWYS